MSDGSIVFDTKIDNEKFESGIKGIKNKLNSITSSIDNLSRGAKKAFDGMSSSQIALVNRIDTSKNKIDELKRKIAEIENQKIPTEQYTNIQLAAQKAEGYLNSLLAKQTKMNKDGTNKSSKKYQNLQIEIERAGKQLDLLISKQQKLENSGQAFKVQGPTQESNALQGKLAIEDGNYIRLARQLEELKNKEDGINKSGGNLKNIFSKFAENVKNSFNKGTISGEAFANSLLKIGNMLKARILRQIVDLIVRGVKDGFNNLVQYSNKLNTSISALKSAYTQLGNSLATVFSPIIQSITPIIQTVIDKIIEAINVMAQFTARIFGNATTFTKAKKVNEDYAKSLGKTNKEQKNFASFDTIEQLNKKDNGGEGSMDPSQMFEEAQIDSNVISFVDRLKAGLQEVAEFFKDIFTKNFDMDFSSEFNKLKNTILKFWNGIKKLGSPLSSWFNNDFIDFLSTFVQTASVIIHGLFDDFNMILDSILNTVLVPFMQTLATYILPFITQLGTQILLTIETLFININNLFQSLWQEGVEPALQLIMKIWDDLWASVKDAWDKWGQPIFENLRETINNIGSILQSVWDNFLKQIWDNFMNILDDLWTNHMKPLWDNILDFIGELINGSLEIYNKVIAPIIHWLVDELGPVISSFINTSLNIISPVIATIIDIINNVITVLKGIIQFIVGVFTGDWKKAWEGVENIFSGIWDALKNIVKGSINFIIDLINGMISAMETGLNWIIDKINTLSWDVPDWVPGIGGETWGFNIPNVEFGRIPRLATGTVVPANYGEFAAILGDNKRETEVVSPLSTMKQALIEALRESGGQDITIKFEETAIGDLVRILKPYFDKENRRIGNSMRVTGGAY